MKRKVDPLPPPNRLWKRSAPRESVIEVVDARGRKRRVAVVEVDAMTLSEVDLMYRLAGVKP